jgi:hypothetical protein
VFAQTPFEVSLLLRSFELLSYLTRLSLRIIVILWLLIISRVLQPNVNVRRLHDYCSSSFLGQSSSNFGPDNVCSECGLVYEYVLIARQMQG